jgi:hypothetical protein
VLVHVQYKTIKDSKHCNDDTKCVIIPSLKTLLFVLDFNNKPTQTFLRDILT